MLYLRFVKRGATEARWGWLDGERIGAIAGDLFGEYTRGGHVADLAAVNLLAPCRPGKIVAVSRNHPSRLKELEVEPPAVPDIFLKAPSAVVGPDAPIVLPPISEQVEHEAELAVVIGRRAKLVPPEDALAYVLGYTCANDVTARDIQARDGQPTRAKGFDTFCPLGPYIATGLDPADCVIFCSVNGQVRQMASTHDMIFSVRQLIAFVSAAMTLDPGDVILTGAPGGVGPLQPGDQVDIEIEGIGRLSNPVQAGA